MNLDQQRAHDAFAFFAAACAAGTDRAGLLGVARQLPGMLQINGLLATWAHLVAKGGPEQKVAGALLAHFRRTGLGVPANASERTILIDVWTAPTSSLAGSELRRLTREAVVYAVWLKRAAETLCDVGAQAGADPGDLPDTMDDGGAVGDPR